LLQLLLDRGNFLNIDISQSSVATYLRFDGIFKYDFVEILPLSLSAKEFLSFENRLTFGEVMSKSLVSCFFDSRSSENSTLIIEFIPSC